MGTCHGPQQPPPEGGHLTSSPNLTMSWDPKVQGTGLPTNVLKVGKNLGKWTRNNFLGGTFRAGAGGHLTQAFHMHLSHTVPSHPGFDAGSEHIS